MGEVTVCAATGPRAVPLPGAPGWEQHPAVVARTGFQSAFDEVQQLQIGPAYDRPRVLDDSTLYDFQRGVEFRSVTMDESVDAFADIGVSGHTPCPLQAT
jgi:hypothetical protein